MEQFSVTVNGDPINELTLTSYDAAADLADMYIEAGYTDVQIIQEW